MTNPQSNQSIIQQFWLSHGYTPAQTAGLIGNAYEESGLSPAASNSKEGAIGIVQWENGRRTALENYAKSIGQSPSDLMVQLNFENQELSQSYPQANADLKNASTPAQAALVVASEYEISARSNWAIRQTYANQAAAGQQLSGATYTGTAGAVGGGTSGIGNAASITGQPSADLLPGGRLNPGNLLPGILTSGPGSAIVDAIASIISPIISFVENGALVIMGIALVVIGLILLTKDAGHSVENNTPPPVKAAARDAKTTGEDAAVAE